MFFTSSYVFRTAADAAARFAGEVPGNVYSRYTNPTVRAFEERIAALEGAEQAVATATGMAAAILAVVMSLCSAGDHVLVSRSVFGSTISLFEKYFKLFGIEVDYVPWRSCPVGRRPSRPIPSCYSSNRRPTRSLSWWTSPRCRKSRMPRGAMLVVDNCFCTPALQQPLKLGADIVVHSANCSSTARAVAWAA